MKNFKKIAFDNSNNIFTNGFMTSSSMISVLRFFLLRNYISINCMVYTGCNYRRVFKGVTIHGNLHLSL